jgi:predicted ATPase
LLKTLAVANYRSVLDLVVPLERLNVVTGANGSGKSNLYRALRLLAETAREGPAGILAREGGLRSTYWAGPEQLSRGMRKREVAVQGGPRKGPVRLKLGFAGEDFGYAISFGLPPPSSQTAFSLDPEIKRECIWAGPSYRSAAALLDRENAVVKVWRERDWEIVLDRADPFDSMLRQVADPVATPEAFRMRESIRGWRFYDHFRTDAQAPARLSHLGTRTPVLHHDGSDLAAAIQTIREIGDGVALDAAVADAFAGARLEIVHNDEGRFSLLFHQEGLLRPLAATELSDGMLRYLLWIAALLTPRPPELMVLNEPETSLHPDLLPPLARLIADASDRSQVWVVTHAARLVAALESDPRCHSIQLEKELGATRIAGQGNLDAPAWHWPDA